MDNFREWLSDNLRYFMLGGGILIVVLVLIFGIRACVGRDRGTSQDEVESTVTDDNQGTVPSSPAEDGETNEEKNEDTNPLEEANADVTALIESYYKALGEKDIDTLTTLVDDLTPTDESKIANATYIEGYEVGNVYTKNGLDTDTYVVYACYNYICSGIDTPVPALSWLYVYTDSDGNLIIDADADSDSEISAYAEELEADADVQQLYADVSAQNEQAQEDDPQLAEFLQGLGEEADSTVSGQEGEGRTLTVTEGCNVRDSADGEIIGGLEAGTQVEQTGQDGEWIQIDYNGQVGYVHSSLLE